MARRVFFSFHYDRDVNRAFVVRNSWLTRADREEAGFFDSSVFESKRRVGENALMRFLNEGLAGCSVTCVLAGYQTAWRRWVRYELLRSFVDGRGILAVRIHNVRDMRTQQADLPGENPLACLGYEIHGSTLRFKEFNGTQWVWSSDVSSMPLANVSYYLGGVTDTTFSQLFATHDYVVGNGYVRLGSWIESAAAAAGR